jgi:hypothetical protein
MSGKSGTSGPGSPTGRHEGHADGREAIQPEAVGRARRRPARTFVAALAVSLLVAAPGCKTGTSMSSASWWSFKGDSAKDSAKLAAAPKFDGDTSKPSETAKPYPTTSTPNGYVITGSGGAATAVAQAQQPSPQQPIVYGQTPPPAAPAAVAATASSTTAADPAAGAGRVTAQVGPYAALAGEQIPPAGQPLPNIGPVASSPSAFAGTPPGPAAAAFPVDRSTGFTEPGESRLPPAAYAAGPQPPAVEQPAARMADARGMPDPRAAEAGAFAGAGGESAGARYSSAPTSRFSGAPTESSFPGAAAAGGFGRPPEQFAAPVAPAAAPAAPATPALLPPSGQPAGGPTNQPMRRPDPGYRPFGTSSYRPAQQLLADGLPGPTTVRTASYEEASPPVR